MSDFKYKDLSGSIHLGLLWYTRELQEHALSLEDALAEAHDELATSSNQALQKRAAVWSEKWQELNIEVGELSREKIENEARLNAEIERLKREVEWLNQQLERYEGTNNRPNRKNQPRDATTGRFRSSVPEGSKKSTAYQMHLLGYSNLQIAQKLNVSPETIKRYIRDRSKNFVNSEHTEQQQECDSNTACWY